MDSIKNNLYKPKSVPHPGETVLDYLESFEWTQKDLALRTDITPKTISEICNGKAPISAKTALAFEKVFRRPAHFWLGLQRLYDEHVARSLVAEKSKSWSNWVRQFPLKEMKKSRYFEGFLPSTSDVELLLNFFGVSSPDSWLSLWRSENVAFRQTSKFQINANAISAWLRSTEIHARRLETEIEVAEFDIRKLKASIPDIRLQTRSDITIAIPNVQEICAAAGVLFVLVPELPRTGISGCARWLTDSKALVALTLRHKRDDIFWFTFFHELGHVILHKNVHKLILDNAFDSLNDNVVDPPIATIEEEANRFAANTLLDPDALFAFMLHGEITLDSIEEFARRQKVSPGIVVGRLQHEGKLPWGSRANCFKQKLDWAFN